MPHLVPFQTSNERRIVEMDAMLESMLASLACDACTPFKRVNDSRLSLVPVCPVLSCINIYIYICIHLYIYIYIYTIFYILIRIDLGIDVLFFCKRAVCDLLIR